MDALNPLDDTKPFSLELMNPNPSSSKTKDGPKYRVSFEMHQEDWQMFMDAETKGMVLEFQGRVLERHAKPTNEVDKLKGGPISIEAAQLCSQTKPNLFAVAQGCVNFQDMIYFCCNIQSRAELDHSTTAAQRFDKLKHRFYRWEGELG